MQLGKYKFFSLPVPRLNRRRIWFAMVVAAAVDFVQLSLGPLGWLWVDEVLDVVAMILTSAAIGFHMLLLPTFVMELFPVVDMLPTWTACTAAVILLRKHEQAPPPPSPPPSPSPAESPPIDVTAEVTHVPPKL